MLAIRVYKDYETDTTTGFRLVDEQTLEYNDFSVADTKKIYKMNPRLITNLTLDNSGRLKLKNFNKEQKQKFYTQTYLKGTTINHYCIILGSYKGTLKFIADSPRKNIICGDKVTLGEIAARLGESDVYKLKLYNAVIRQVDGQPSVKVYDNNGEYLIPKIKITNANDIFGKGWRVEIDKVTQAGAYIKELEHTDGSYEESIPNGVCHIEKFYGGVNVLTLPKSMHSFGEYCMEDVDDIIELRMDEGIRVIPVGCCRNTSLQKVIISPTTETIEKEAFAECCDLQGPIVSNAIYVGKRAFYSTNIGIVSLDNIEVIDIEAFAYCRRLRKVKLGNNLREIRGGAFIGCTSLEEIVIPASVEKIGPKAFQMCKKLKKIKVSKTCKIHKSALPKNVVVQYYD